jgi:hypothetical protein
MATASQTVPAQGTAMNFQLNINRSPQFYFPDGNLIFLVSPFRVMDCAWMRARRYRSSSHRPQLCTCRRVRGPTFFTISDLLVCPYLRQRKLLMLTSQLGISQSYVYPTPATMTGKDWLTCYAACERWDDPSLKPFVMKNLCLSPPAVRLIAAIKFHLRGELLPEALEELCQQDGGLDSVHLLAPDVLVQLINTREKLIETDAKDYNGIRAAFKKLVFAVM